MVLRKRSEDYRLPKKPAILKSRVKGNGFQIVVSEDAGSFGELTDRNDLLEWGARAPRVLFSAPSRKTKTLRLANRSVNVVSFSDRRGHRSAHARARMLPKRN